MEQPVDESTASLRPHDHNKNMAGTFKITIPDEAKMPQPSNRMYEALALRAWIDYREAMEPHLKAVWESVAHGQIGIIAIYAGGKVEAISDAD